MPSRIHCSDSDFSTQANAAQSPFFSRLSPKIRNRIYDLMLGGKYLHVYTHFHGDPKCCLSQVADTDIEIGALGQHFHRGCRNSSASATLQTARPTDINLLRTCRQIHQEAALLPSAKNTFLFGYAATSLNFTRKVLARQRRAITSVAVDEPYYTLHSYCPNSRGLFPKLAGLKRVRITLHILLLQATYTNPSAAQFNMRLGEVQNPLEDRSLARCSIDVAAEHRYGAAGENDAEKRLGSSRKLAHETQTAKLACQREGS